MDDDEVQILSNDDVRADRILKIQQQENIAIVNDLLSTPNIDPQIDIEISQFDGINVYISDLLRLKNTCFLNDNVIQIYLLLLFKEYNNISGNTITYENVRDSDIYIFNTHFMDSLCRRGYEDSSVKGVTRPARYSRRQINIFEKRIVIIPINKNRNHWVFLYVNMQNKTINYYDSFQHEDSAGFSNKFLEYLVNEHQTVYSSPLPRASEWRIIQNTSSNTLPYQTNGYDCGVYILATIHFLLFNVPIDRRNRNNLTSTNVNQFRKTILHRLLRLSVASDSLH